MVANSNRDNNNDMYPRDYILVSSLLQNVDAKLKSKWLGPYVVTSINNNNVNVTSLTTGNRRYMMYLELKFCMIHHKQN